jgi:hypothetical protein
MHKLLNIIDPKNRRAICEHEAINQKQRKSVSGGDNGDVPQQEMPFPPRAACINQPAHYIYAHFTRLKNRLAK